MTAYNQDDAVLHRLVYTPKDVENTRIDRFRKTIASKYDVDLPDYYAFWRWTCDHPADFWAECWDEVGIIASQRVDKALPSNKVPIYPPPKWFEGSRLNFAENLLRHSQKGSPLLDQAALIQTAEADPATPTDFNARTMSNRQLRRQVACAVRALRARGVQSGDRVASYSSNCAANVVAFLAAASLGAIWCSSAADFAPQGVLERLKTVRPKVLFSVDGVRYNGRVHDHLSKLDEVVRGLKESISAGEQELEGVVVIAFMDEIGAKSDPSKHSYTKYSDFLDEGKAESDVQAEEIEFAQLDFNHPLWILFSSGTTGKPKAIMHRSGGMLLQMAKEHLLHGGLSTEDRLFYFSTTGWMMNNWQMGAIFAGGPIVLFDGSPLKPVSALWEMANQMRVTVFGTSAAYLSALEKSGFRPRDAYPDLCVKQVLSTGSPLRADLYPWIMDAIGDVLIGSITGGTDLCSLFAGHNVALPVRAGEIQARNLGMDVDVFDDSGKSVAPGKGSGDLVCKTAFPAQPLGFFSQPEQRHFETYYAQFDGVWYHGDYVALSEAGGLVMLGRSDGILNPMGVRCGSADWYDALEQDKAAGNLKEIETWLVCALKTPAGDDEVVVLFLVLKDGPNAVSGEQWTNLVTHINSLLRRTRSARHVPKFIKPIVGVPLTLNGKLAEVPAKKCKWPKALYVDYSPVTFICPNSDQWCSFDNDQSSNTTES
jgi:acetoacetyl-CoA synthetase